MNSLSIPPEDQADMKSIEIARIWTAGLAAMTRSAHWLVFAASVALVRAEAPCLAWTVPSPVAAGERMQDIRSQWIDDDVCIVLRRGGVLGRYHPKEMKVAWERTFEGSLEGECANRESVWMVQDIPGKDRGMIRISTSDGTIAEKLRSLESRFGVKNSLPSGLEWLPGAKLLAIETLSDGRSDLYLVDPAKTRASVMVPLKGYFWNSQALDQAVTYVHHGVIYRVDAKKGEHHKVWDSGLGEGGDDFPAMRDFAVTADGGFIAIIDKGGWTRGFTVHQRKGQEGEIQSATTDLDAGLLKIDLPRCRILHVGTDKPAMQWLDFEAKLMGEPSKPLKNNFWHVSISPDGHRAGLVDSESNLLFFTLP